MFAGSTAGCRCRTTLFFRSSRAKARVATSGARRIVWKEVLAGEKAFKEAGSWLPDETLAAFRSHLVGIKGPLTKPIGGVSAKTVTYDVERLMEGATLRNCSEFADDIISHM